MSQPVYRIAFDVHLADGEDATAESKLIKATTQLQETFAVIMANDVELSIDQDKSADTAAVHRHASSKQFSCPICLSWADDRVGGEE